MELQKGPTMTRTQEWNCLSAQQLVHQLLVCDIEHARRFVQANAKTGWRRGREPAWRSHRGNPRQPDQHLPPTPAGSATVSHPAVDEPAADEVERTGCLAA